MNHNMQSDLQTLQWLKLNDNAIIPTKSYETDSGYDLYTLKETVIQPWGSAAIPTGVAANLPDHIDAQVRPRSGHTRRTPIRVQLGTIDNGYTGDITILVDNFSSQPLVIPENFKLAQYVLSYVVQVNTEVVEQLPTKDREGNGFGSTDV